MNIRTLSNRITGMFGYRVVKDYELDDLLAILEAQATYCPRASTPPAEAIVFSKDRALQLHALLSSYFEQVTDPVPVHLFYDVTNSEHQKSYDAILEIFGNRLASISTGKPFKQKLIDILDSITAPKLFFLVDDDLLIEKADIVKLASFDSTAFVPSLRLGKNLTRNYIANKEQPHPMFLKGIVDEDEYVCWKWAQGTLDWQYLFSVDGNIFSSAEMRAIAKRISFSAPNSFEAALLRFWWPFQYRNGVAHKKSRIVNIPCNRVQNEIPNTNGNVHQDYLLEQWNKGLQMDYQALYHTANISAHQDFELKFIKRSS